MADILDKAATVIQPKLQRRAAALDFSSIFGILIDLLKGCFASGASPDGVLAAGKDRTRLARFAAHRAVAQKLREDHGFGGYRRHNGDGIVEAILDAAADATPADIVELASV